MIREPLATDQAVTTRRRPLALLAVAAMTGVLLAAVWWGWAQAEPAVPVDRLRIAEVVRGDIVRDVQAPGRLVAAVSPTLYAPAAGTVVLATQAGDTVRAGQVLA
ncbi:MAG: efflux RND transporter periplasmic adaptor subunit, partial [Rhodoferax sp.]|nr:efflux RND transporter periplasmic adaptor subunit [Rhodoferax sp.]